MDLEDLADKPYDEMRLIGTIIKTVQSNHKKYKKISFGLKFDLAGENSVRISLVKRFDKITGYFDFFGAVDIIPMTAIVFFFKTNYQLVWSGPKASTIVLFNQDHVGHFYSQSYDEIVNLNTLGENELIREGLADLSKVFSASKRSGAA